MSTDKKHDPKLKLRIKQWKRSAVSSKLIKLYHDKRVTAGALATFVCLQLWVRDKGKAWPNRHTMANAMGVSDRVVRYHLHQLEAAGVITRHTEVRVGSHGPQTVSVIMVATAYNVSKHKGLREASTPRLEDGGAKVPPQCSPDPPMVEQVESRGPGNVLPPHPGNVLPPHPGNVLPPHPGSTLHTEEDESGEEDEVRKKTKIEIGDFAKNVQDHTDTTKGSSADSPFVPTPALEPMPSEWEGTSPTRRPTPLPSEETGPSEASAPGEVASSKDEDMYPARQSVADYIHAVPDAPRQAALALTDEEERPERGWTCRPPNGKRRRQPRITKEGKDEAYRFASSAPNNDPATAPDVPTKWYHVFWLWARESMRHNPGLKRWANPAGSDYSVCKQLLKRYEGKEDMLLCLMRLALYDWDAIKLTTDRYYSGAPRPTLQMLNKIAPLLEPMLDKGAIHPPTHRRSAYYDTFVNKIEGAPDMSTGAFLKRLRERNDRIYAKCAAERLAEAQAPTIAPGTSANAS